MTAMILKNYTPHPLTIENADGVRIHLAICGPAPRLEVTRKKLPPIQVDEDWEFMIKLPLVRSMMGEPTGLPEPESGVILIVSALVAEHPSVASRTDLAYPGEAIRDASGKIEAALGLCAGPGMAQHAEVSEIVAWERAEIASNDAASRM